MDYTVHGILQARTLEWVAFPFSRGFSQPRDQTQFSCIAGGFITSWAIREAQELEWQQALPFAYEIYSLVGQADNYAVKYLTTFG